MAGKAELVVVLTTDLAGETADLLPLLTRLGEAEWDAPTPAAGWSIRDQVTHLAFFDDATLLSLRDRAAFLAQRDELLALGDRFSDVIVEQHRHLPGGFCLEWLASSRASLIEAYKAVDPATRLPWYGPDFSVPASITGRLMETWAHGQDIADATGAVRQPTARLRHVADIGIRAFAFCFQGRGLAVPAQPVRVELAGPRVPGPRVPGPRVPGPRVPGAGVPGESAPPETWTWGPDDAENRVTGDALDFCLVVTQRRHLADTAIVVHGEAALDWLRIAQAFAGPPGPGRRPLAG
jgi:uncharacterized protein (TIGR03084 family)